MHNLLIKFFAGEISDEELDHLRLWLESDPENRRIFDEENELWQEASFQSGRENYKVDSAWMSISSRAGIGKNNPPLVKVLRKNNFKLLTAAAVFAGVLVTGYAAFWFGSRKFSSHNTAAFTRVLTREGEKAQMFLSDSSEIILNSGSTIQYDGSYNVSSRTIKLTGEAYFNVKTNAEKPFIVQLDQMSITATGTRFNIFSFPNENRVETTLEKGIIKVNVRGKEPISVKPGEQLVYFVNTGEVFIHDVNTETYTSWKENMLRFHDTPFEEVLRGIARKYNVTFEVTNHSLFDLKYTATFIDESIEEVMDMLKTVSPIYYRIYYRTTARDKQYLKPRIVVGERKKTR